MPGRLQPRRLKHADRRRLLAYLRSCGVAAAPPSAACGWLISLRDLDASAALEMQEVAGPAVDSTAL